MRVGAQDTPHFVTPATPLLCSNCRCRQKILRKSKVFIIIDTVTQEFKFETAVYTNQ